MAETGPVAYEPAEALDPARARAEAQIMGVAGVEGMGEGLDATGNPAWLVYVNHRGVIAALPARVEGREVIPVVTGPIDALKRR